MNKENMSSAEPRVSPLVNEEKLIFPPEMENKNIQRPDIRNIYVKLQIQSYVN